MAKVAITAEPIQFARHTLLCAAALGLALVTGHARAEEARTPANPPLGENPISVIMKWRPTAEPKDMPDFVKKSRPAEPLGYTPLTAEEPKRPARKTQAQIDAEISRLDAAARRARSRSASDFSAPRPRVKRPPEPEPPAATDE